MSSNPQEVISFEEFCSIYKEVLAASGLSPHLLRSLHRKLEHEIFDAGDYFILTRDEETDGKLKVVVSHEDGVQVSESDSVFLIDHAWTYRTLEARKQLCECPGLLPRVAKMMGYSVHGEVFQPDDDIVNNIMKDMWKLNQTYSMAQGSAEVKVPFWYVMDEFGSSIQHSDSPTIAVIPFFYQPKQLSFSIMWPLVDLDYGDDVSRDYANFEKDPVLRTCKLLPWVHQDMTDLSSSSEKFADKRYEDRYSFSKETLPGNRCTQPPDQRRLKVFMNVLSEYLIDVATFEIVEDISDADVIFTKNHIKDFKKFSEESPNVFLCQFPGERILFCKDFFVDIARRSNDNKQGILRSIPQWCPVSFDLHSQLPTFVSHFQKSRSWKQDQNCWITKPWNLPRNIDVNISNNLDEIIRQREVGNPKIVSKYIEDPVLLVRPDSEEAIKFELRFYVLLASVQPLKMHVCEIFTPRFAKKPFSLSHLDDVETHFTFEHDSNEDNLSHGHLYIDLINDFEKQYKNFTWQDTRARIHKCINEFMKSAVSRPVPYGVGHYANSRALYGFDVILEWEVDESTGEDIMQPVLLECCFMPELQTICKNFPSFLCDAFKFLFLGDESCQVYDISDL